MKNLSGKFCLIALLATAGVAALAGPGFAAAQSAAKPTQWTAYGGDKAATHFSPLTQITAANVDQLKPVWVYNPGTTGRSWENEPLLIDGMLYVSDATSSDVVALEPETGKELWRHKAPKDQELRMRSLAYWPGDSTMKPRLIVIWGSNMFGLDLKTGEQLADWPAEGFNIMLPTTDTAGRAGFPDKADVGIYKNLMIIAGASGFLPPPGRPADPRAYDLRTGKMVWTTRLIPGPGEPGGDSWGPGSQQVLGSGGWGFITVDDKTNTVYLGTDSGSPDLVGIWRPGQNKWADSTVALDARTGKLKWAFQNNYHSVYDYDTMAAPVLTTITKDGKKIPLVVQTTKQGQMWIFDARAGKPLYPYKEMPVAQSDVPGEKTWPTQPFTMFPPPLAQNKIDRDHLSQLSPKANADCKQMWDDNKLRNEGPFTPPHKDGWTVMMPGAGGGIDWGGASIDPDLGYAITNVTNMPTMVQLSHGADEARGAVKGNDGWRFSSGYVRFSDTNGVGCAGGMQGELIAVNLATGKIAWDVPLGTLEDIYGEAGKQTGATNVGPSLVTRGGVIFIGAASDSRFHAYDVKTGKLLWQTKLGASADAGPMTYIGKDGRQYVLIASGGPGTATLYHPGSLDSERGEYLGFGQSLVAFALPRPGDKAVDIITPFPKRQQKPGEKWVDQ